MRKTQSKKSMNLKDKEEALYRTIQQSKFYQQRLSAWRPIPSIGVILIFYSLFSLIFIILGIILIVFSNEIKELEIKYNTLCKDKKNQSCDIINIEIGENIDSPINIYYKIYGFFQNNRRYLKSRSPKQLEGKSTTLSELKDDEDCEPIYTNRDMGFNPDKKAVDDKTILNPDEMAIPCGIMAKSFFNDSFTNFKINKEDINVNEKNIAWEKDKELFKNTDLSKQWINIEDEHFIVWMRPSGLSDVKKLWGRIENINLKTGDKLSFTVMNNYDVDIFGGDKSIILSNSNAFGGDNTFLGICFIYVGGVSLLLGIGFFINYCIKERKEKEK